MPRVLSTNAIKIRDNTHNPQKQQLLYCEVIYVGLLSHLRTRMYKAAINRGILQNLI